MSEEDQDLVVGRLVREYSEARRRVAVMRTDLDKTAQSFAALANGLQHNVSPDFALAALRQHIGPGPLAGYDFSRLLAFLEEYTSARLAVQQMEIRLRELGLQ